MWQELGRNLPVLNDKVVTAAEVTRDAATDLVTTASGQFVDELHGFVDKGVSVGQGRSNGRGIQSTQMLRYPIDSPITAQGHYILFEIHRHQPGRIEITGGTGTSASATQITSPHVDAQNTKREQERANKISATASAVMGEESGYHRRRSFQLRNQTKTVETQIALYMPPSVSVSYNSSYANEDISMVAEAGFNFVAQVIAGGIGGANLMSAVTAGAGNLMEAGRREIIKGADALAPGVKALANITAGSVMSTMVKQDILVIINFQMTGFLPYPLHLT